MISISNFTSQDNPPWRLAEPVGLTRPARPRRPARPARPRVPGKDASAGRVVLSWLAAISRRLGDRLFAMNDTEAYWRGWQLTKTQGGLGRSYRDPRFDTVAECPKCRGAEATAGATARATARATADLPCLPCLGTGRITRREAS